MDISSTITVSTCSKDFFILSNFSFVIDKWSDPHLKPTPE
jgi:hypothetical protein